MVSYFAYSEMLFLMVRYSSDSGLAHIGLAHIGLSDISLADIDFPF
jgi:hypothetical protein